MKLVIRATEAADWQDLKTTRLAALLDAPTAFGASHCQRGVAGNGRWR